MKERHTMKKRKSGSRKEKEKNSPSQLIEREQGAE